jgi:hypothetical protein
MNMDLDLHLVDLMKKNKLCRKILMYEEIDLKKFKFNSKDKKYWKDYMNYRILKESDQ